MVRTLMVKLQPVLLVILPNLELVQENLSGRPALPGAATAVPLSGPPATRLWTTFPSTMVYIGQPVSSRPANGVQPTRVHVSESWTTLRASISTSTRSAS